MSAKSQPQITNFFKSSSMETTKRRILSLKKNKYVIHEENKTEIKMCEPMEEDMSIVLSSDDEASIVSKKLKFEVKATKLNVAEITLSRSQDEPKEKEFHEKSLKEKIAFLVDNCHSDDSAPHINDTNSSKSEEVGYLAEPNTPDNVLEISFSENSTCHIVSSDNESIENKLKNECCGVEIPSFKTLNDSPVSIQSDSSDKTVILPDYNWLKNITPSTSSDCITPIKNNEQVNILMPSSTNSFEKSSEKRSQSSKKKKLYSPVTKKTRTPKKNRFMTNHKMNAVKQLFQNSLSDNYEKACIDQSDKIKFFLTIIHNLLQNDKVKSLLDVNEINCLKIFSLSKPCLLALRYLYWNKERWYRKEEIMNIGKSDSEDFIEELFSNQYLQEGNLSNMDLDDFEEVLKVDEIKAICKDLKLKYHGKKTGMEQLKEFGKNQVNIMSFFGKNFDNAKTRVLKMLNAKAGLCYKLSETFRLAVNKCFLLSHLGIDYSIIRDKKLELMYLNLKSGRERFPITDPALIDDASTVFPSKNLFDLYFTAHCIFEIFTSTLQNRSLLDEQKCIIVEVLKVYKDLPKDCLEHYMNLQPWLRRYTAPHIYLKIIEEAVEVMKKFSDVDTVGTIGIEVLDTLITQKTFKTHKKGRWYDEKAKIYHKKLSDIQQAISVVVEGIDSDADDVEKDYLRKRANNLIRHCKNEEQRKKLKTFVDSKCIAEHFLPSQTYYKQAMENEMAGKSSYSTKTSYGLVVSSVEGLAMMHYLDEGTYEEAEHWEGEIVRAIFFAFFWDIIYYPTKRIVGLYLSEFQTAPNDMYSRHFYENRREAIEQRLTEIRKASLLELAQVIEKVYHERDEGEHSGLNHAKVRLLSLQSVCSCLGGNGVAVICSRLARDYARWQSGFPDLTLWCDSTKKIKFVEVKSENDKASLKQIQWMQYLLENNISTEFLYIGTKKKKL